MLALKKTTMREDFSFSRSFGKRGKFSCEPQALLLIIQQL